MIEMDRFVITLAGERQEEITRHSRESVSTMKNENGMTINRMAQMIEDMVTNGRSDVTDTVREPINVPITKLMISPSLFAQILISMTDSNS